MVTKESIDNNHCASEAAPLNDAQIAKHRIVKNYNCYFSTGVYQARYPNVNQQTLSIIKEAASHQPLEDITQIFDYGCGEGRYVFHLLSTYPYASISAYDISSEPINRLASALDKSRQRSRVALITGEQALAQHRKTTAAASYSLALLLFGVLSHVDSLEERQALLVFLRDQLDKEDGRLIISVPNKARRFGAIQRRTGSHEITYTRTINHKPVSFYYHLYSVDTICAELAQAGLDIISVQAESLLPESWITKHSIIGWVDKHISRLVPANFGYGIVVTCRVADRSSNHP